MLILDNDVLRKYTRPQPDGNVVRFLEERHAEEWTTSALVAFEWLLPNTAKQRYLPAYWQVDQCKIERFYSAVAPRWVPHRLG